MVENILLAFSVYSNGVKILNTDQGAGTLGALNGVRFLSMAWVILGHTFFFAMGFDGRNFSMQKTNKTGRYTLPFYFIKTSLLCSCACVLAYVHAFVYLVVNDNNDLSL